MDLPTNLDDILIGSQLFQKGGIHRQKSHYDVLQVDFGSSRTRIREAYIRLKHAYSNQSQALYSLIDDESSRQALVEIEEAFKILNDDNLRRDYDEKLHREGVITSPVNFPLSQDPFSNSTSSTDSHDSSAKNRTEYFLNQRGGLEPQWEGSSDSGDVVSTSTKTPKEFASTLKVNFRMNQPEHRTIVEDMIKSADDLGDGSLYKKIRESLDVPENEVQQKTKISIEYIKAIETNTYDRLPAVVYVRGFLKSYLQYLGIHDSKALIAAFSERMISWQKMRNSN